jgi:glycine/D-amino acid oxidase-like deaminating enzyme
MGSTVRRLREGRIVVRNTFTYNPDMATDATQVARIGPRHDRSFRERFAMLSGVEMEHRWAGTWPCRSTEHPVFGEVAERVYAACGCNGLGTVKGTLFGKLAAELAVGEESEALSEALAAAAPVPLYPEPLMTTARSRLWWMQKRAGREL